MIRKSKIYYSLIFIIFFVLIPGELIYGADVYPEIEFKKEVYHNIELNEIYIQGNVFGGELSLGRRFYRSGPGYFSQLLLSDQSTSLELIMYEGKFCLEGYENNYTMLIAYLDEGVNKQLFYHRVSNDSLIEGLEIGLAESVIVSEHVHPAYYLPIPFIPFYLISYLVGQDTKYNHYEDKYIGIDFTYQFPAGIELYGELLVDEYPQTTADNNPDKRGHLLGLYFPRGDKEFRIEYSNVFNYVYLHRYPQNSYTYEGKYLGHWLGHDGDILNLELRKRLNRNNLLKTGLSYLRKGIGDMKTDFGPDHKEKKFLSRVTKREILFHLGYLWEIDENISFEMNSSTGKAYFEDRDDENIFKLELGLIVNL